MKLHSLGIPPFTGKSYLEFSASKNLYEASVHKNLKLLDELNFQYLKSLLRDKVLDLTLHIEMTEKNYKEAWENILRRFDKKGVQE